MFNNVCFKLSAQNIVYLSVHIVHLFWLYRYNMYGIPCKRISDYIHMTHTHTDTYVSHHASCYSLAVFVNISDAELYLDEQ